MVFNILLDELPTKWGETEGFAGYELNTDFRVGIQIMQAMTDSELSESEKFYVINRLLFKKSGASVEEIAECVEWFLSGWNHDKVISSGKNETAISFDNDHGRIYSAFMSQYHINLNTAQMHFWEFMILLTNLEDCAFTKVIDIRTKKITSKMSKEEKEAYKRGKKIYSIHQEQPYTEEEDEMLQAFLKAVKGS